MAIEEFVKVDDMRSLNFKNASKNIRPQLKFCTKISTCSLSENLDVLIKKRFAQCFLKCCEFTIATQPYFITPFPTVSKKIQHMLPLLLLGLLLISLILFRVYLLQRKLYSYSNDRGNVITRFLKSTSNILIIS